MTASVPDGNELPGQRDELVSLDALVHRRGKLGMCRDNHESQSDEDSFNHSAHVSILLLS